MVLGWHIPVCTYTAQALMHRPGAKGGRLSNPWLPSVAVLRLRPA